MEGARGKIRSFAEIQKIVAALKKKGRTIVTTNGCFDILHVGHVRNLETAKRLGDILVVGVNSDQSVRRNKGKGRPITPERERAEMIAALSAVDYVFLFGSTTPDPWLKKLKPHIHTKGADRTRSQIVERHTLAAIGTKLVLIPYIKHKSTTRFINYISHVSSYGKRR